MKVSVRILLVLLILSSCNNQGDVKTTKIVDDSTDSSIEIETNLPKEIELPKDDFQDLMKYIGTYPKQVDFFENPLVVQGLKEILKDDFDNYLEFVSMSRCGEMSYKYGLIYGDVSQLHVGGYSSMIFIDVDDKKLFLFWLKETVRNKNYEIYGQKPTQANVLNLIEQEMNIGWGHVATFSIEGDSIKIESK